MLVYTHRNHEIQVVIVQDLWVSPCMSPQKTGVL